jgi:hypothetical protein
MVRALRASPRKDFKNPSDSWILDSDLFSPEDNGLSRDKKRCQITTWLEHLTANLDLY